MSICPRIVKLQFHKESCEGEEDTEFVIFSSEAAVVCNMLLSVLSCAVSKVDITCFLYLELRLL